MRILLAQINPTIGDLKGNCEKIIKWLMAGREKGADLVVFPELALSGYPPEDLLLLPHFIDSIDRYLELIVQASQGIAAIVGMPKHNPYGKEKRLFNSAVIINNGTIAGFQDKTLLPTYDVFDERRYFEPGAKTFVWELKGKKVGITICEDIWQHAGMVCDTNYRHDPISDLSSQKPDVVVNLSASPFKKQRCSDRLKACSGAAKTLKCPVLLCNQVGGNDSLIFDGYSLYVGADGRLIDHAKGFEEDGLFVNLEQEREPISLKIDDTEDLFKALVLGVKDYFRKLGFKKACIGISGGVDSAVVACIAAAALGEENILGLVMPSRYTLSESTRDAAALIENLGIAHRVISIEQPFECFLNLLEGDFAGIPHNAAEENVQARIRGIILMFFSNKLGYIVLSTGNKSEMAMGYSTLYGDMCGGLGVLSDVVKRDVYELAKWINKNREIIPLNTIKRPPTAELREGQLDTDSLPEYEIVDKVLAAYVESHLSPEEIVKKYQLPEELVLDLIRRIHLNEYKRRQSPPGLRVTSRAFSAGRRFPIVHRWVY